jgi:CRISPR-associated protein Cst1
MLKFTGHPLVDVGAATIWVFSGKSSLEQLTERDMDKIADYIETHYVINPLKSFLNVAFPNSGFTQPAFEKTPKRRKEYAQRVTRGYKKDSPLLDERCAFTGEPAIGVVLGASEKDDYPKGRAFRHNIPMFTGEDVINFHPYGDAGLPISGIALLCIQALPLGCSKCGGKLLAVHSDNPDLTYKFAKKFLNNNRNLVDLAEEAKSTKLPEASATAKTLLIHTLIEIEEARILEQAEQNPYSVTAYHLSNSGQSNPLDKNPPLEIYHLPLEITDFLASIVGANYRAEWQKVERRAWQLTKAETTARKEEKSKKGKKSTQKADNKDERPRRNFLYEDLFRLPENAPIFIRLYFLRIPKRNAREDDPRRQYSLKSDAELVSWKLTQLFLERILRMKPSRIESISKMGEQLAQYVHDENDTRFFERFYSEQRNYSLIRNELIRVNKALLKRGQPPLVKFEPYMEVFEDMDERGRTDWRLARDLVLIRMIEKLYELRWIQQHVDAIPETREEISGDTAE